MTHRFAPQIAYLRQVANNEIEHAEVDDWIRDLADDAADRIEHASEAIAALTRDRNAWRALAYEAPHTHKCQRKRSWDRARGDAVVCICWKSTFSAAKTHE